MNTSSVNFNELSDKELISLMKGGNEVAFSEIYNRTWEALYLSAFNILGNKEACMDILQDIFTWLWEHREEVQPPALKPYLLAAVKHKTANYIRHGHVKQAFIAAQQHQPLPSSADYDLELKELRSAIRLFTQHLPERSGKIFHLSRFEHLSNKEIAAQLNISEKTVENQLTIVLRKLRMTLGRLSSWIIYFL